MHGQEPRWARGESGGEGEGNTPPPRVSWAQTHSPFIAGAPTQRPPARPIGAPHPIPNWQADPTQYISFHKRHLEPAA